MWGERRASRSLTAALIAHVAKKVEHARSQGCDGARSVRKVYQVGFLTLVIYTYRIAKTMCGGGCRARPLIPRATGYANSIVVILRVVVSGGITSHRPNPRGRAPVRAARVEPIGRLEALCASIRRPETRPVCEARSNLGAAYARSGLSEAIESIKGARG